VTNCCVHPLSRIDDFDWDGMSFLFVFLFLNYCQQTYMQALFVILSSYYLSFLWILPWCFGVWPRVCVPHTGSC
jgi:hypothetical protein